MGGPEGGVGVESAGVGVGEGCAETAVEEEDGGLERLGLRRWHCEFCFCF